MKKHLLIFGTRPEAIKMIPLYLEFKKTEDTEVKVCITSQHREMLEQVLDFFEIKPDYDLALMKPNQNLHSLTGDVIQGLKSVIEDCRPDFLYVHGDTTTTLGASLAGFYSGVKVCHVEAGLRTNDLTSPFPEEMNRRVTTVLTNYHFAPTELSKQNLLKENQDEQKIVVTGNTVIDALLWSVDKVNSDKYHNSEIAELSKIIHEDKKLILVTGHRRENHGQGFVNICQALKQVATNNPEVQIIYPVHLNPNVQKPVYELLDGIENVVLIAPLSYPSFVWLMEKAFFIITDSGGVQEEAPSLGKPVLVMRDTTERPEAVKAGTVQLVGTDTEKIIHESEKLLSDSRIYTQMSRAHNPYGDGFASKRIIEYIQNVK